MKIKAEGNKGERRSINIPEIKYGSPSCYLQLRNLGDNKITNTLWTQRCVGFACMYLHPCKSNT